MTRKITAILAAAVVLTSADVASAQTNSRSARTVAVGQSSEAIMLDRACAAAAELPTFELMGFPITRSGCVAGSSPDSRAVANPHTHAGWHASLSPPSGGLDASPKANRGAGTNETVSFSTR